MSQPQPSDAGLEVGLALPSYRPGATPEGMVAALETCARLGWRSVWTTDREVIAALRTRSGST